MQQRSFVVMWRFVFSILILLVLPTQAEARSKAYQSFYAHLDDDIPRGKRRFSDSDYYIVFCVCARHLDYTDTRKMIKSLVKHASGGKGGDVGHSWIYLKGGDEVIEGGQSGELGHEVPKYFDGVMNYVRYGYADPTPEQKRHPRQEPNPIKYLWEDVNDGFWQHGNGTFRPTFAAKYDLTREQFEKIKEFISPENFDYRPYSLVGKQCSSFIVQIAEMIGLHLDHQVTVELAPKIKIGGRTLHLWEDPQYSSITFSSPDILERSLMQAVREGKADYAKHWYRNRQRSHLTFAPVRNLPQRFQRLMIYYTL